MVVLSRPQAPWDQEARVPQRRFWRHKFGDALRGLKRGIRGQSSFFVHFFFTALVVAAALVLRCTLEQWCLLLLCIGLVLTAEFFNSAVETFFRGLDRGLDEETKQRTRPTLDIAAAAVLLASAVAVIVGLIIFGTQLVQLLS